MTQNTAQRPRRNALLNSLYGLTIPALLFTASSIGFPHIFLTVSGSVLQGIAIASTLILIAASGLLITTQPQTARTASVVGAIVTVGGAIALCCFFIAPGIQLAVTVGITYVAAWVFVSAALTSIVLFQSRNYNRSLLSKPIIWGVLGCSGFLWLAITLFSLYGLMAVFWLFLAPALPWSIGSSFIFISRNLKQSPNPSRFYNLQLTLYSIFLLAVIALNAGQTLDRDGVILWTVEIIVLTFATLTALLLSLYGIQFPEEHASQVKVDTFGFGWIFLFFITTSGLWGYSDHFWQGVSFSERLNSLSSATLLDKFLETHLWNQKITISADDQFLANSGEDPTSKNKVVQLWNLKTGELTRTFPGYSDPLMVTDASSQPVLLMQTSNQHLEAWNLTNFQHRPGNGQDEKLLRQQQTQNHSTFRPAFLPPDAVLLTSSTDGKTLATGFDSRPKRNRTLIWDAASGKLLHSLSPGNSPASDVAFAFSPTNHLFAITPSTRYNTGSIYLWRLPNH